MSEKVCVIIGAGRGMGAATARLMHNKGYKLALMSPSESCETLAQELSGIAVIGRAENGDDTQALFDDTMAAYGRIDSLLIHVGGPPKGDLLDISDEDWVKANEMILMPVTISLLHPLIWVEQSERMLMPNIWRVMLLYATSNDKKPM